MAGIDIGSEHLAFPCSSALTKASMFHIQAHLLPECLSPGKKNLILAHGIPPAQALLAKHQMIPSVYRIEAHLLPGPLRIGTLIDFACWSSKRHFLSPEQAQIVLLTILG
jgi:hypothetical protein